LTADGDGYWLVGVHRRYPHKAIGHLLKNLPGIHCRDRLQQQNPESCDDRLCPVLPLRGQQIALSSNTGTGAAHLHFEVRYLGE